jgi:hypothetical protein
VVGELCGSFCETEHYGLFSDNLCLD